ncbi:MULTISPECIES: 30S ribosomal protein S19e [Haloarcula]|uniref:Small ribosomal subunit protein eS19 n=2 Tax=Haloarcula TaxID=2237 RepID=A0A0N0BQ15_9EURY|nr:MULTISPECIES: 30S ribosomal protein S19e [Haloarcula]AUG46357.1 30S ribosomal protein S19e [Haloarcula taiwanensis]KAA9399046.1 30S ribosomal protein S19e [Haloarcula sp. CBA1129]KAA9403561.1 30S ribosomal protein S19e [Haloarcula sp. CBA1130]KOX94686.1 30S ribosomal protein S19 [Haloarcula rubripromontorii]NLV07639.1 30S ribosomal protein S19e [Haloarcula rubripromontorii]
MATLYDVPPEELIEALTETLADEDDIEAPDWAEYTKTGVDRELPPEQEDFWARRAASLLRKVAVDGPVGVNALRSEYGTSKQGTTRYRVRPHQKTKGSGNIIRTALQQLEDAGYVETSENDGRRVTGEGRSLLDDTAGDLLTELDRPELERYA